MTVQPWNVARLSEIITELGRLWNVKMSDGHDEELVKRDGARGIEQLQKAVNMVMSEGKRKMVKAKSKNDIHKAFVESLDKGRCMMHELPLA
ncbi:hypothetical protein ACFLU8_01110 [Chloroflexota bacterium]